MAQCVDLYLRYSTNTKEIQPIIALDNSCINRNIFEDILKESVIKEDEILLTVFVGNYKAFTFQEGKTFLLLQITYDDSDKPVIAVVNKDTSDEKLMIELTYLKGRAMQNSNRIDYEIVSFCGTEIIR